MKGEEKRGAYQPARLSWQEVLLSVREKHTRLEEARAGYQEPCFQLVTKDYDVPSLAQTFGDHVSFGKARKIFERLEHQTAS